MLRANFGQVFSGVALLVLGLIWGATALADVVSGNNKSADPPLFPASSTSCSADLLFKAVDLPWPIDDDNHSYVVVTSSDGSMLELRGGTEKRGPSGNPFLCADTGHEWGVVVPYIGKHGRLADGVYSPDGKVANPTARVTLGKGPHANICAMANCVMGIMKSLGQSCEKYIVGTAWMRNSNTMVSQAMSACGMPDGRPASLTASGWGEPWSR